VTVLSLLTHPNADIAAASLGALSAWADADAVLELPAAQREAHVGAILAAGAVPCLADAARRFTALRAAELASATSATSTATSAAAADVEGSALYNCCAVAEALAEVSPSALGARLSAAAGAEGRDYCHALLDILELGHAAGAFDDAVHYAAEALSIALQCAPSCAAAVPDAALVARLATRAGAWADRAPASAEERDACGNLWDALCAALLPPGTDGNPSGNPSVGRTLCAPGTGFAELLVHAVRCGTRVVRRGALRALDFLLARPDPTAARAVVDAGALGSLFPVLMGKASRAAAAAVADSQKHNQNNSTTSSKGKKKSDDDAHHHKSDDAHHHLAKVSAPSEEEVARAASIVAALLESLPPGSSRTRRVLAKLDDDARLARIAELHVRCVTPFFWRFFFFFFFLTICFGSSSEAPVPAVLLPGTCLTNSSI
jgi:hypothetical protein